MIDTGGDRFIPLQGCLNFRDLGGYGTRDGRTVVWGRVFRSDDLDYLTLEDANYIQRTLGIVVALDLRSPDVATGGGLKPGVTSRIRYHNLPFFQRGKLLPTIAQDPPSAPRLVDIYSWVLRNRGRKIATALATLAEADNLPAVFYCNAGKDRTGILAAIVLGVLGVGEEDIVKDYVLTNWVIDRIIDRLRTSFGGQELERLPPEYLRAETETMRVMLDSLRRKYGSIKDYVRAQGVSDAVVDRLKEFLLE